MFLLRKIPEDVINGIRTTHSASLAIHRALTPIALVPGVWRISPLGKQWLPSVQIDARDGDAVSDFCLAHHLTFESFAQTGMSRRSGRPAGLDVGFRLQAEGPLLLVEEDVIRDHVYREVIDDAGFERSSSTEEPLTGFLRALRL